MSILGGKVVETVDLGHTDEQKRQEYDALVEQAQDQGYKLGWAAYEYKKTYGEFPPVEWKPQDFKEPTRSPSGGLLERSGIASPDSVKRDVAEALRLLARERGVKDGWAAYRYKELFGEFPPRERPSEERDANVPF